MPCKIVKMQHNKWIKREKEIRILVVRDLQKNVVTQIHEVSMKFVTYDNLFQSASYYFLYNKFEKILASLQYNYPYFTVHLSQMILNIK